MPRLVFVLGGAGAGKTTLAKALAGRSGAAYFDMDTLLRPAAVALMTQAGLDPEDRDSSDYKRLCRELGYRITMDAALENISVGNDAIVIGPFTKETEAPAWIEQELASIGASLKEVEVKVIFVTLADEQAYYNRIVQRGSSLDQWKLEHWDEFRRSLAKRELKWRISASSVLYFDNTEPLSDQAISSLEQFVYSPAK
ncbi:AAA family ATPase [Paenibacillus sp. N4]|uniref:AAA family ATPase n=1 Tax=Paenibacillus vietnamensis TaxID=2590547 RepID=UPI001CD17137|nr:AAA family ATPase [Paenibacillus vietnamensis]MCA0756595.1 AAA family ATPase [Paenibacillus vietnamensis]